MITIEQRIEEINLKVSALEEIMEEMQGYVQILLSRGR